MSLLPGWRNDRGTWYLFNKKDLQRRTYKINIDEILELVLHVVNKKDC